MCTVCGCGPDQVHIDGQAPGHFNYRALGRKPAAAAAAAAPSPVSASEGALDYGAGPARAHAPGLSQARMVKIEQDILSKNDQYAQRNRDWLEERSVLALNLGPARVRARPRSYGSCSSDSPGWNFPFQPPAGHRAERNGTAWTISSSPPRSSAACAARTRCGGGLVWDILSRRRLCEDPLLGWGRRGGTGRASACGWRTREPGAAARQAGLHT